MITFADRKGGFPHSEIFGSQGARASPKLIAACHVLHRLSTPRHPSEALMRLIVLSKTHAWGQKVLAGRTKDRVAPTHALRFVFADNDVFSDPSSSTRGRRIDPSIHDVRFAADGLRPGRKVVFPRSLPPSPRLRRINGPVLRSPKGRNRMVEPDGIEPTTSCLQSTRSTN
jgi:hypothetical protein